ncbi:MAG: hypothetical protein EOM93_05995 [Gammaproteobacteria bacterium]|nr:hypothetical protein [Gammaproteobacteria bacterium]
MTESENLPSRRKGYGVTQRQLEDEFLKLMDRRKSFYKFTQDLILSKPGYTDGEHIKTLCDHAQQVYDGDIDRLIVTLPPRHMKSTLFSEAFPAWCMGNDPQTEVIISSYNDSQSAKMMTASRMIMEEPEYRRTFPSLRWAVDNIHDAMLEGKQNGRPNLISRGPGSGITGSGADIVVMDDLFKSNEDAYSSIRRDKVEEWYKSTILTRLSPGGRIILVGTRWHYDDLIGRLISEEPDEWTVLHMPAISDEGMALWPKRYNIDELIRIRASMGTHMFSAIYQGRPTPSEGGMFKRQWFQYTDTPLGPKARRVRYYDMASTESKGDWTVGLLMAIDDVTGHIVIEDVDRAQRSVAANEENLIMTANRDGTRTDICMEQEGGSAGQTATRSFSKLLRGYPFSSSHPTGPKETRARAFAAALERGDVKLLRSPAWNRDYIDELCEFPYGTHDDQVDTSSGAYNFLMKLDRDTPEFGNVAFF